MSTNRNQLVSINRVCEMLGKSRSTLWRWTQQHAFPSPIRIGPNSVAYVLEDIEAWIETKRLQTGSAR